MMRIWKKIMATVTLALLMVISSDTVSATEIVEHTEICVYDDAGLMTEAEIAELQAQILYMKGQTGWDIFAVTTANANGKSAMEYADDFYDERTSEDSDGVLVLIDMDNREIYLSTYGEAIRYLTDEHIEWILDDGFSYVSNGEYAGCLSAMLSSVNAYYEDGIDIEQYNYEIETGAISEYRSLTLIEVGSVVLLGAGAAAGIYFGVSKSYRITGGRYEYPYMKYSKIDLVEHEDQFIRAHTTHHRIQTSSSSGGSGRSSSHRSTTHRSSSGRSHGGGGRKF